MTVTTSTPVLQRVEPINPALDESEPWDLSVHLTHLLEGYGVRPLIRIVNDCLRISNTAQWVQVLEAPEFPVEGDPNQVATDEFLDGALVSQLIRQAHLGGVLEEIKRIVAFRTGGEVVKFTTLSLL